LIDGETAIDLGDSAYIRQSSKRESKQLKLKPNWFVSFKPKFPAAETCIYTINYQKHLSFAIPILVDDLFKQMYDLGYYLQLEYTDVT